MSILPDYNDRQPLGQSRGAGKWLAGVAAVALMVSVLLAWWMVDRTVAQPAAGGTGERPVLFLGNESLPPMSS